VKRLNLGGSPPIIMGENEMRRNLKIGLSRIILKL
jgi:hypothetical protein